MYDVQSRASVPLILSSDLLIYSFTELQGGKISEKGHRMINFQHNGYTKPYKSVHLLAIPMNIIDSVSDKRFFIGDPVSDDSKKNGLSVWYTNPYTKVLLDVNTGIVR